MACDQSFKLLFDNDPLQYCRNSLVISVSRAALKGSEGREFDITDVKDKATIACEFDEENLSFEHLR